VPRNPFDFCSGEEICENIHTKPLRTLVWIIEDSLEHKFGVEVASR
jgi:hypothetical protein